MPARSGGPSGFRPHWASLALQGRMGWLRFRARLRALLTAASCGDADSTRNESGEGRQAPQFRALGIIDAQLRWTRRRVGNEPLHLQHLFHARAIVADGIAPRVARKRPQPFPDGKGADEVL